MKLNIQYFADGKVVIETDLDDSGFSKGLSKMQSLAKTGFKVMAGAVGVVAGAMGGALANGVKFNSEIEQLQTSFEVMTGSADKATEVIQKLKDVGAKTPYDLKGLANTTQLLMQYGFTADDAYDATINLGDIAQGSSEKMESIALAFGQMSSLGKVTMQDIKQMINAGFNPLQAIAEMTGETMQEVNKRYEEGSISVEEITEAMKYASGENGKYFQSMEKQSKTLAGQVSTLKDNFDSLTGTLSEGLSQSITGDVLPSINDLLTGLEEAFKEGGISSMADALGEGIANMLTAIVEEAPKFFDVAFQIIDSLIKGIQNNLPKIVSSAIQLAKQFIETILKMLPDILKLGIDLIVELANGIAEQMPELIPLAIDTILTLVDTLLDNIDLIIDAGINMTIALAEGLMNALPNLIDKIPIIIEKLLTAIMSNLPKLLEMGMKLTIEIAKGLIKSIPEILAFVPKMFLGLINAVGSYLGQMLELGKKIVNKIKDGFSNIKDIGKNLVKGLWEGINNQVDWVLDKIKGFGKSVVKGIKSIFGIKSPSKVMRDEVGKFLAEGIGVGFEDELDNVYRDMQNAIDFNTDKMSANVQTNGTYQMAMAGLPEFNLLDNTENTTQLVVNGKVLAEVVNTENKYREVAKA